MTGSKSEDKTKGELYYVDMVCHNCLEGGKNDKYSAYVVTHSQADKLRALDAKLENAPPFSASREALGVQKHEILKGVKFIYFTAQHGAYKHQDFADPSLVRQVPKCDDIPDKNLCR